MGWRRRWKRGKGKNIEAWRRWKLVVEMNAETWSGGKYEGVGWWGVGWWRIGKGRVKGNSRVNANTEAWRGR